MFDEGQELADPYSRTKFESEKIVREEANVPWRVYRPGIVVGHSQTGEMDKIDGPYYFFKVIQRLRGLLPPWMPTVGLEGGKINLVPVDFVAAAMDHIAHQDGLDGRAFHLTDPTPKTAGQVINVFARAAHAPEATMRIDRQMINVVPKQARKMIAQLPPVKRITDQVLGDFGIPREVALLHRLPERLRLAGRAGGARGLGNPGPGAGGLRRPAVGLLGAQPRPGPVQGPQPARRDRGQGRRHHRRVERHRQGSWR